MEKNYACIQQWLVMLWELEIELPVSKFIVLISQRSCELILMDLVLNFC